MSDDELYTKPAPKWNARSFWGAYFLCYFFGCLGLHRFYTGRNGSGLAQLLLTLSGIGFIVSSIWALVDFVRIAIGNFTDYEGDELEGYPGCAVVILSTLGLIVAVGIVYTIISILFLSIGS